MVYGLQYGALKLFRRGLDGISKPVDLERLNTFVQTPPNTFTDCKTMFQGTDHHSEPKLLVQQLEDFIGRSEFRIERGVGSHDLSLLGMFVWTPDPVATKFYPVGSRKHTDRASDFVSIAGCGRLERYQKNAILRSRITSVPTLVE